MTYGPSAKQLSKVKVAFTGKEIIDVEGYFEDGFKLAKRGRDLSTGSLKLKENIEAYTNGYNSFEGR